MNNAAAISAVYCAIAHYRRRLACTPRNHSAREIVQMSMLAEYLHETHTPAAEHEATSPQPVLATYQPPTIQAAA